MKNKKNSPSQERRQSRGMEQRQRQIMTPSIDLSLMHEHTAGISSLIIGKTIGHIVSMCREYSNTYQTVINDQNLHGIASRVARDVAFRLANDGVSLSKKPDNMTEEEMSSYIKDKVEIAFDDWWNLRLNNIRTSETSSEVEFAQKYSPINWEESRISVDMIAEKTSTEEDEEVMQGISADVTEAVANIDLVTKINPVLREQFERVRTADYGTIHAGNIDELLPKIEESYNEVLISAETLELLAHQKTNEFVRRTEKGVFLYGFHERVKGQMSVAEQMRRDFTHTFESDEPTYEGRYLMDDQKKLLAWLTYWQPTWKSVKKNGDMVRQYLRKGVTGGEMAYTPSPTREFQERFAENTIMIDTIRGGTKLAAHRLFALVTHEMCMRNKELKQLLGYRLHDLVMDPALETDRDHIRLSENRSSSTFFSDRECVTIAYDHSKDGPCSERDLSDGRQIRLNPVWVAFAGRFSDVMRSSKIRWRDVQWRFGDVSEDEYKRQYPSR